MPTPTPTSASTTDDADDALFRRLQLLFKEDPPSAELHDLLHLLGETPAELGFSAPAAQTSPPQAPRDAYSALETLLAPFAPPPPRPAPSLAPIPNRAAPAQRPLSPPQLTPELVRAILCTAPEPKHGAVHDTPPNRPPTQHPTPPAPHMSDVESHPAFAPQPRHSSAPPGDQITHPAFASHFASQLNRTAPPVPAHRRPDAFASDQRPQQHTPGDEYGAQQRPQQHSLGNQYQRPLQHRQPQRRPLPQSQQQPQAPGNRSAQQPGPFRTAHSKLLQDRRRAGKRGGGGGDGGARPGNGCVRGSGGGDGPTDLVPEGSLRAMGRAVLGPAKRPRFSAPRPNAGAQQSRAPNKDGTTRDDLPEIPNVEPRLVEMIMNEMLDSSPGVDWDDIAGLHFAKRCVMEAIVWPMKRPDIFTGLRGPPKGLLLFGPPGTGKTLIGRAIASKSGAKFFNISASSLMSKWVGEGEKMVRALFAVARVFQPSVVFIDEIDSLLTQRTDSDQESSRRVKTEFLVQMDGAGTSREDRVLVVGATNRPQELDEAARRRLVKRLYIPLPDGEARKSLVKRLLDKQANCCSEQDYEEIVVLSKGYSGSDMYALCAEAALGPVRDLGEAIGSIDADSVRPINKEDFKVASRMVRASVSDKDLDGYVSWNESFGSFPMTDPKAAT